MFFKSTYKLSSLLGHDLIILLFNHKILLNIKKPAKSQPTIDSVSSDNVFCINQRNK